MKAFFAVFVLGLMLVIVLFLFGQGLELAPGLAFIENKDGIFLTYVSGSFQVKNDSTIQLCCDEDGSEFIYTPGDYYESLILYRSIFSGSPVRITMVGYSEITDNTYFYRYDVYNSRKKYVDKHDYQRVKEYMALYNKLSNSNIRIAYER